MVAEGTVTTNFSRYMATFWTGIGNVMLTPCELYDYSRKEKFVKTDKEKKNILKNENTGLK